MSKILSISFFAFIIYKVAKSMSEDKGEFLKESENDTKQVEQGDGYGEIEVIDERENITTLPTTDNRGFNYFKKGQRYKVYFDGDKAFTYSNQYKYTFYIFLRGCKILSRS